MLSKVPPPAFLLLPLVLAACNTGITFRDLCARDLPLNETGVILNVTPMVEAPEAAGLEIAPGEPIAFSVDFHWNYDLDLSGIQKKFDIQFCTSPTVIATLNLGPILFKTANANPTPCQAERLAQMKEAYLRALNAEISPMKQEVEGALASKYKGKILFSESEPEMQAVVNMEVTALLGLRLQEFRKSLKQVSIEDTGLLDAYAVCPPD